MSSHLHLVLQTGNEQLSRGLKDLSFRYTRWVNWHQKRTGHLFQGRYKAFLDRSVRRFGDCLRGQSLMQRSLIKLDVLKEVILKLAVLETPY